MRPKNKMGRGNTGLSYHDADKSEIDHSSRIIKTEAAFASQMTHDRIFFF